MFSAPHLLKIVEGADLRSENVDDHIARIDQHPVAGAEAFDVKVSSTGFLQILDDMIGDRSDVTLRTASGHNHVVGE